ncbi:MAG: glycosyltransferase family 4 protein [Saprospiraceae bacterium]|nr:glycosyltransferase family 4 protein [Saprospiraceae bacterium]
MRIGVNGRLFYQYPMEGITRYTYHHVFELAQAHPEDQFYIFLDRKLSKYPVFPSNVTYVKIIFPTRHPLLIKVYFDYILPYFFKRHKIDVFYSGDYYISFRARIPQVMVIHDLAYLHYPDHLQQRFLSYFQENVPKWIQKASALVTVSEYVKNDVERHFQKRDIIVAGNAVQDDFIKNPAPDPNLPTEKPYFIYVGSIHPRKNIENMIRGFVHFKNTYKKPIALIIAGRIAWKSEHIYKLFDKEQDIHYIGEISEERKWTLLQNSIALVYLSHFEGFGIPILEGFAAKTTVITSNKTSMPEVGKDAALYVDPSDISGISTAFNDILSDKVRISLISKGSQRLTDFSWKHEAEKTYKAIKAALNSSNLNS